MPTSLELGTLEDTDAAVASPVHSAGPHTAGAGREAVTRQLLVRAAEATEEGGRRRLHDEVVVLNMGVARAIAARYRDRGIAAEDLVQAAYVGLVKAVRGFDPAVGADFLKYAVPTIRGEVRHQFRDAGWAVRPPRRIQDLQPEVHRAAEELSQKLNRSPKPREVAHHLGISEELVLEALSAVGCFSPASLDQPVGEDGTSVADLLGGIEDREFGRAEARLLLGEALRGLKERDRRIITMRFFHGMTQEQIAQEIGVSQMQVSRLIARILRDIRRQLAEPV